MTVSTISVLSASQTDSLQEFEARASKFKSIISLPKFETTTNQIQAAVKQTIATGNAALDKIAALSPAKVNFENTVRALDDMGYEVGLTDNRLSVIKETSTSEDRKSVV